MNDDPYAPHIMAFLDSCAFDPQYSPEDKFSKEIEHPNTPIWVKKTGIENHKYLKIVKIYCVEAAAGDDL